MNKRLKTLWKSARTQLMKMQIFASCLLAAVVLLGCSDYRGSPTAPSSVTLATAVSNSTSVDTTLVGSETNTGQLPARTPPESNAVPLTANTLHPADHDGSPFTIELFFSAPVVTKPKWIRGKRFAFRVANGSITKALRQDRERRTDGKPGWKTKHWQLTVTPSGEDDVRLLAEANENCAGSGAFCTDDRRSLSHALDFTIRGPAPETAEAVALPAIPGSVGTVSVRWDRRVDTGYYVSWDEVGGADYYTIKISSLNDAYPRCSAGGRTIRHNALTGSNNGRITRTITAGEGGTGVFSVHAVNGAGRGPCSSADRHGTVSSNNPQTYEN